MSEGTASRWYAQIDGDVRGPYSSAELRDLARTDGIRRDTPVSKDRVRWVEAGRVRGLEFVRGDLKAAVPAQSPPPIGGSLSAGAAALLGGAAALGLVAVLCCGGFGLYQLGGPPDAPPAATGTGTQAAGIGVPPARSGTPATHGPPPQQLAVARTLAYWRSLGEATRSEPDLAAGNGASAAKARAAAARRAAGRLRALPSAGVDPDAIACGLELAGVLDGFAALAERTGSPALVMEAIVRSGRGDPWGASADLLAADAALKRRAEAAARRLGETRALLSTRYGVEFPVVNP